MLVFTKGFLMLASRRSNPCKHPRGGDDWYWSLRPLDHPGSQCILLFTSFTFCNITGSCSLIPKENIRCSITWVSLIECLLRLTCIIVIWLRGTWGDPILVTSFINSPSLLPFQERFRSITKSYYRNSVGVVLSYDICNRDTFIHIPVWMQEAKRHIEPHKAVFVLVS